MSGLGPGGPEPAVAVIVPVRGPAPFLEATLRSLAAQTHPSLEPVVVDDGADPDLEERVLRVLPDCAVVTARAPGLAAARNTGAAATRAPFVAFLDSDDLWLGHKLERQLTEMHDERIGVVCCSFLDFENGVLTALRPRRTGFRRGEALRSVVLEDIAIPSATLCRRSVLEAVGGFPEDRHHFEDFALFSRLARITHFAFVPEPLVLYRRHSAQMTRATDAGVAEARAAVTTEVLAALPEGYGAEFARAARAHDQLVTGHWHRLRGRRGAALRCAWRAFRLQPRGSGWAWLIGLSVLPGGLERRLRRAYGGAPPEVARDPAVTAALALD